MNITIEQLKDEIRRLASEGAQFRKQIQELAWKPDTLVEVAKLRAQRDLFGHRCIGKTELKRFRRPETGQERYDLWRSKRQTGSNARYAYLAYGMLRGKAYLTIESKCEVMPNAWAILRTIDPSTKWGEASLAKTALIRDWLAGGLVPVIVDAEEAA